MSKIDVVSQICVYSDYPIYRQLLTKYRDKFNKIILYPSRQHGVLDMEEFLKQSFPETWVTREPIDYGVRDWRQAETEPCLELSDSEWILFLEQDFFTADWDKLWVDVEKAMETADLIGLWNATHFPYIHPCFLLIRREILDKTSKDFSAHPEINGGDHFSMLTRDVEKLGGKIVTLQDLGYPEDRAFHLGGLTYPYQDFKGDDTIIGVKYPDAFYTYNALIRPENFTGDVVLSEEFTDLSRKLEAVMDKKGLKYDSRWEKFFKLS